MTNVINIATRAAAIHIPYVNVIVCGAKQTGKSELIRFIKNGSTIGTINGTASTNEPVCVVRNNGVNLKLLEMPMPQMSNMSVERVRHTTFKLLLPDYVLFCVDGSREANDCDITRLARLSYVLQSVPIQTIVTKSDLRQQPQVVRLLDNACISASTRRADRGMRNVMKYINAITPTAATVARWKHERVDVKRRGCVALQLENAFIAAIVSHASE